MFSCPKAARNADFHCKLPFKAQDFTASAFIKTFFSEKLEMTDVVEFV